MEKLYSIFTLKDMNKETFKTKYNGQYLIIVDMDNVKVDFQSSFEKGLRERLPEEAFKTWDNTLYWIEDCFEEQYHQTIHDMVCEQGFFLNMNPINGAIEAVQEMADEGLDIIIATTPHPNSRFCIDEKMEWIKKHMGDDFVKRLVFTHDKTILTGKVLIDDKPEILGHNRQPSWTHVVFDAPYNQRVQTPHRLKQWKDWRSIVYPILEKDSN